MAGIYNKRDIQQQCTKQLENLKSSPITALGILKHITLIYVMIRKLSEYKQEELYKNKNRDSANG